MSRLDISVLTTEQRATGAWAASLLQALARDEAAGRRLPRLTEPNLATWNRFRGRLTASDLVALLFEDAAVLHRIPFDSSALGGPLQLDQLPVPVAETWLKNLSSAADDTPSADYITAQACLLGLPARLALSKLPAIKRHQKILELPGTGGQLAHHLVATQTDLTLHDNILIACGSWQELTLAGIVALDLGTPPHTEFAVIINPDELHDPDHPLRQRSFDLVVGLHPDKGGPFRVDDQLAIWFSSAMVRLV